MAYVRKAKTASGATAVQIVEKRHGVRRIIAHVGSAHDDAELVVLLASARDRIHAGQQVLDLPTGAGVGASGGAVVTGSASEILWEVLCEAYRLLGLGAVADEAFRALVLVRIVKPTSKLAAVGVLDEVGVPAPQHLHRGAAPLHRQGLPGHPRHRLPAALCPPGCGGTTALSCAVSSWSSSRQHVESDATDPNNSA